VAKPAGGAHSGPPDPLAGSRERATKGMRGVRREMKGSNKEGEWGGKYVCPPLEKTLRAPMDIRCYIMFFDRLNIFQQT